LLAVALGFCLYGFYRRWRRWRLGQPENRRDLLWRRLKDLLVYGPGHKRIMEDKKPGVMHLCLFWGFTLLLAATVVIAIQVQFRLPLFRGAVYLGLKAAANIAGLLVLIGVGLAVWRRWLRPSGRLGGEPVDAAALGLIFLIVVTGYLVQGTRMAAAPDPWGRYALVGYALAPPLRALFSPASLLAGHRVIWWLHAFLSMVFIAWLPYGKLGHVFTAPAAQFLQRHEAAGVPEMIDFTDENAESFGKNSMTDFSWKAFFDADACLRCGRCEGGCPAYLSGKGLNPQRIMRDLRSHIMDLERLDPTAPPPELIGGVIREDDLWACTTCRSCERQCPVFAEHVDKFIDLRRYSVLTTGSFPAEAQLVFRNLENNGNPWGMGRETRGAQLAALNFTVSAAGDCEILYWPGCAGVFDKRARRTTEAVGRLLDAAGVSFAVWSGAGCCGDPARRLGNEYLFQELAAENIAGLNENGARRIVTQCPHCLHVLQEEYPQFGGHYEVVHHSVYLEELRRAGRLRPLAPATGKNVTYHDPCYLCRYRGVGAEPRALLRATGLSMREMPRHWERSLCCGAGGGRMWLEEKAEERVNRLRVEEAAALGTDYLATACPFCLTMLGDGLAALATEKPILLDIAELLLLQTDNSGIQS
jgi:Fe-S oxidoreductase/nitrate reductase gamma subunit